MKFECATLLNCIVFNADHLLENDRKYNKAIVVYLKRIITIICVFNNNSYTYLDYD